MSETNISIPMNNPDNSIRRLQAASPIRFDPLNEVAAFDISPPNSPPPPYSRIPPPDAPTLPPYIICTCSSYENPTILVDLGFHSELSHEIWDKWQLHKRQHPEVYQNVNSRSLLYLFFSFVFQATQLPFAFPGYDPRYFHSEMCVYLSRWGIPHNEYFTREWDEAQRIERCACAAAEWTVLILSKDCEGHPRLTYDLTGWDGVRMSELRRMAMAATSVI
ncbi:uncharacterized protein EAF02_005386 [Botrytis sinoallii]|uniref:uncharacterized protein n=1 Tax=Botrytis sinoallii TaxID=1463999 RepID=UPI0018FF1E83|nr:uncharacterized protein EAF02_005386 [Botrytis sinoallii]KAF7883466.1 hypothetical protein EAF02_005386 [Botrytis sinoallii]